jgi:hypothetical protein
MNKPVNSVDLLKYFCSFDADGLKIKENTPFDKWEEMGRFLLNVQDRWQLYIGDWINFGEKKYGEKYAHAVNVTSLAYQTLNDFAWVAGKVPQENRRTELAFSFHKAVAPLSHANQKKLLQRAVDDKLTVRDLRDLVSPLLEKKEAKKGTGARVSGGSETEPNGGDGSTTSSPETDKAFEVIDWLASFLKSKDYDKLAAQTKNNILRALKPIATFAKANG